MFRREVSKFRYLDDLIRPSRGRGEGFGKYSITSLLAISVADHEVMEFLSEVMGGFALTEYSIEDLELIPRPPSPKPNSKNGNFVGELEFALWYSMEEGTSR